MPKRVQDRKRIFIFAAEDAKFRLIQDFYSKERKQVEATYSRQIGDLRKRLATEKGLTVKACVALNDTIVSQKNRRD